MTDGEFIELHRNDDTRLLALRKVPDGVDVKFCLQQIEGWQLACRKIPRWAACKGILFPARISLEQCSSESTAIYKRQIIERLLPEASQRIRMADFTGGFGIDFSYLAPLFREAVYVERQEALCRIARHNLPLLGVENADVICAELQQDSSLLQQRFSFVFLDPARRDEKGAKTVFIEDCTPNVAALYNHLLRIAPLFMIKLSPMLDITAALRSLPNVCEVHVVSVNNECKELLLVSGKGMGLTYHCVNLESSDEPFIIDRFAQEETENAHFIDDLSEGGFLYEPNASILKAGLQDALCVRFPVCKLHPQSHLFFSQQALSRFPGRSFRIVGWSDFSKAALKGLLKGVNQANITLRNFPSTTDALRRRLSLRDGGTTYLFATTLLDGRHVLVRCEKSYCSGTTA